MRKRVSVSLVHSLIVKLGMQGGAGEAAAAVSMRRLPWFGTSFPSAKRLLSVWCPLTNSMVAVLGHINKAHFLTAACFCNVWPLVFPQVLLGAACSRTRPCS
jgi:hypothetical protein